MSKTFHVVRGSVPDHVYFYDVSRETLQAIKTMTYTDALAKKIKWADDLLRRLQREPFYRRDVQRANDVHKAIRFNQKLMEE